MLNKAMLLPAGGIQSTIIAVRAKVYLQYGGQGVNNFPPPRNEWKLLDGESWGPLLEAPKFLRVKEYPKVHLVLKKILKRGRLNKVIFIFSIEPDVPGDDDVLKLQQFLLTETLRPVLFDKNLKVQLSSNTRVSRYKDDIAFIFIDPTARLDALYQKAIDYPEGSKSYYLLLDCYVGLTR